MWLHMDKIPHDINMAASWETMIKENSLKWFGRAQRKPVRRVHHTGSYCEYS